MFLKLLSKVLEFVELIFKQWRKIIHATQLKKKKKKKKPWTALLTVIITLLVGDDTDNASSINLQGHSSNRGTQQEQNHCSVWSILLVENSVDYRDVEK